MVIPELIRLLTERGVELERAMDLVERTCAYTNHTILAEALEKWPASYLEQVTPQLLPFIRALDERARKRSDAPSLPSGMRTMSSTWPTWISTAAPRSTVWPSCTPKS